jgi:hypothetical protein
MDTIKVNKYFSFVLEYLDIIILPINLDFFNFHIVLLILHLLGYPFQLPLYNDNQQTLKTSYILEHVKTL